MRRKAFGLLLGISIVFGAFARSTAQPNRPGLAVEGILSHPSEVLPIGEYGRHSWTLRNDGPTPITLRTHFTSGRCGFSLWRGASHVLPPGSRRVVSITYPTPRFAGVPFESYVELHADDPERPRLRLRVYGTAAPAD